VKGLITHEKLRLQPGMFTSYTAARPVLFSFSVMRFAVFFMLVSAVSAGCPSSAADASFEGGGDAGGSGNAAAECSLDSDCQPAAAKCCDCPTYATPKTASDIQACAGVMCPVSTCPANVRPACSNDGRCELACVAMACTESCADGFAVDDNGCLTCQCAQVATRACLASSDCTRVAADCCGCVNGGVDTAVPTAGVASHHASLDCPSSPSCPAGNSCQADLVPACIQGACDLVAPLPAAACGRPDLPACPSAQVCTVNADSAATAQAVGECEPAT